MRKSNGKKAYMAIKIDLEKAYDRVSWEAIKLILNELNVPPNFERLILDCVSSSSFNVLWNCGKTKLFRPSRGPTISLLVCFMYGETHSVDF